ncbi:MAG: O-antigen ligase family protein [Bacteroidia bacterium]
MELLSQHSKQKYFEYIHYVFVFLLPIAPKMLPVLIILISLLWLLEGDFKTKFQQIISSKLLWVFISIYLIYLLGMTYTFNTLHGWKDLETKFTLLLFPLIYATSINAKKIQFFNVFKYLAYGCSLAALVGLGDSTYNFIYELYARANNIVLDTSYPYTNYFFSAYVSPFLHTGYFALYINVSIAFLLYHLLFKHQSLSLNIKRRFIFILIFLSCYNVLLLSKIGLISMIGIYVFIIYLWTKQKFSFYKQLLIVSLFLIFIIGVSLAIPKVRLNFEHLIETTFSKNESELDSEDGSASRLVAWKTSFDLAKIYFLTGVGTGDVKQTLTDEYKKRGYQNAYEIQLNSHNQYIQTTLAVGLAGLLALLLLVFFNIRNAIRKKDYIHFIFILLVSTQFFVEASLETQAGVIFISFFNSAFNFIFTTSESSIKTIHQ